MSFSEVTETNYLVPVMRAQGAARRDHLGRDDGLAEDAAIEHVADDFEFREFGHRRQVCSL